eukprot:5832772-Prymnesium_polylepis.1
MRASGIGDSAANPHMRMMGPAGPAQPQPAAVVGVAKEAPAAPEAAAEAPTVAEVTVEVAVEAAAE